MPDENFDNVYRAIACLERLAPEPTSDVDAPCIAVATIPGKQVYRAFSGCGSIVAR